MMVGLVIYVVVDGIVMGVLLIIEDMKFGFIIFIVIMIYKVLVVFGLMSVLLK